MKGNIFISLSCKLKRKLQWIPSPPSPAHILSLQEVTISLMVGGRIKMSAAGFRYFVQL
jgi:hypothetical protein